jgi:outer membrane biosynthesis protein TonB
MERSLFIKWGIAASVLTHILVVAAILLSTDVRKYEQAAPEEVAVDIVVPDEPEKPAEAKPPEMKLPEIKPPEPSPTDLKLPESKPQERPSSGAAGPAPETKQTTAQAQEPPKPPASREPSAPPQPQPQQQPLIQPQPAAPPPSSPPPSLGYVPAQSDLTVKYGVMLGLPDPLPPLAATGSKDDDKEAGATATSNLASDLVAAFRRHLRSCSRLPASISRGDRVMVKLRVIMTPNGRLAADPEVIEVASPAKAFELKQAAVSALTACQPYAMLPPDRYKEWKVLELSFTPDEFPG